LRGIINTAIIFLALILVLPSCDTGASFRITKHELTVRQFPDSTPQTRSMAVVTGSAYNLGNKGIVGCRITVIFFDGDGNMLGTGSATKEYMGPADVWNFSIQITGPDAWKARTYKITATNK